VLAGVNLPVLRGAYDHDLAPNERHLDWGREFSPLLAFRYLSLSRWLGFGAVRIWLCENGEGVKTDRRGRIVGLMPELLESVDLIQQGARLAEVSLYWSLLDGNAWQQNGDGLTRDVILGAAVGAAEQQERFCELVAAPIAAALDPEITFALEAVNEPETLSIECVADGYAWPVISGGVATLREAIRGAAPDLRVTAGVQAVFLPGLLGHGLCVDAVDIHAYHPDGGLPSREQLPVDIGDLPLIAGECGTAAPQGDSGYLENYLHNARTLGYEAAFLWKLEGEDMLVRHRCDDEQTDHFEILELGAAIQHLLTKT
jgi:hypothetical protein